MNDYVFQVQGTEVRCVIGRPRGCVVWCSHWELVPELVKQGMLREECYGPSTYNHVDVFPTLQAMVAKLDQKEN